MRKFPYIVLLCVWLLYACGGQKYDVSVSGAAKCPSKKCEIKCGTIYTEDLLTKVPATDEVLRSYFLNKPNIPKKSPFVDTTSKVGGLDDLIRAMPLMRVYGINPIFALALSIAESAWGRSYIATNKFNLWGWQAYDGKEHNASKFKSYTHGFSYVFSRIKYLYLQKEGRYYKRCKPPEKFQRYVRRGGCTIKHCGASLAGMNCKYSHDPKWAHKVRLIMSDITKYVNEYRAKIISDNPFGKSPFELPFPSPIGR